MSDQGDEVTVPPLRLVTSGDEPVDQSIAPTEAAPTEAAPAEDAASAGVDPLTALVQRIEGLPLRERPAAFERLNANLVAELNALEEV